MPMSSARSMVHAMPRLRGVAVGVFGAALTVKNHSPGRSWSGGEVMKESAGSDVRAKKAMIGSIKNVDEPSEPQDDRDVRLADLQRFSSHHGRRACIRLGRLRIAAVRERRATKFRFAGYSAGTRNTFAFSTGGAFQGEYFFSFVWSTPNFTAGSLTSCKVRSYS